MSYLPNIFFIMVLLGPLVECYLNSSDLENLNISGCFITSTKLMKGENYFDIEKKLSYNSLWFFKIKTDEDNEFQIGLRLKDVGVLNQETKFYLYLENKKYFHLANKSDYFDFVQGFVLSNPNSSGVSGYIKKGCFYGTIFFIDYVYYVEDIRNYAGIYSKYNNTEFNAIIYKSPRRRSTGINKSWNEHPGLQFLKTTHDSVNKEQFKSIVGTGKVCTLLVILDNSFLKFHENNLKFAVTHVVSSIEEANSIFRSTDFDNDGISDNLGILIKHFIVLQSEDSPMNILPKFSETPMVGKKYIRQLARYDLLTEVCLGIAFTAQVFAGSVLGTSYAASPSERLVFQMPVGGICDRPLRSQPGQNLNAIAVSIRATDGVVSDFIFALSIAHELGHSFGSDHDSENSKYLMAPRTPSNEDIIHMTFSNYSKSVIMSTVVSRGHCLEKYEAPFCGNGIAEPGEECDCGPRKNCADLDSCCTPRAHETPCRVNRNLGFECHPSQGICCDSECRYKDLKAFGIDCKNFARSCPCQNTNTNCSCGINGECTKDVCSSRECTMMQLVECVCPADSGKCRTCCFYDNACQPSSVLISRLLKTQELSLTLLSLHAGKNKKWSKFGIYQDFCDNDVCVGVYFREVDANEYCLLYGQLGICSENYRCLLPETKKKYPTFIQASGSSRKPYLNYKLLVVFILYHFESLFWKSNKFFL